MSEAATQPPTNPPHPLPSTPTLPKGEVTEWLERWCGGDAEAMEQLIPLVYDNLKLLARRYLRKERSGHTLETSALVHEAYFKMVNQQQVTWRNRAHFYAIAAQMMRRILVDHARGRSYQKRGAGARPLSLDALDVLNVAGTTTADLVELDTALAELAEHDPEKSRIVELRFFGGLTHPEIAQVLGVSLSTVERQWRLARAWLYRNLA